MILYNMILYIVFCYAIWHNSKQMHVPVPPGCCMTPPRLYTTWDPASILLQKLKLLFAIFSSELPWSISRQDVFGRFNPSKKSWVLRSTPKSSESNLKYLRKSSSPTTPKSGNTQPRYQKAPERSKSCLCASSMNPHSEDGWSYLAPPNVFSMQNSCVFPHPIC